KARTKLGHGLIRDALKYRKPCVTRKAAPGHIAARQPETHDHRKLGLAERRRCSRYHGFGEQCPGPASASRPQGQVWPPGSVLPAIDTSPACPGTRTEPDVTWCGCHKRRGEIPQHSLGIRATRAGADLAPASAAAG